MPDRRSNRKKYTDENPKKGPDKRRSCSRTPPTTESRSSSHRRSPSPFNVNTDIASILEDLSQPWEMQKQLHLPMHLKGCKDCSQFARHVVENTRQGGIDAFKNLQRDHWADILDSTIQDAFHQGFDKAKFCEEARSDQLQKENDELQARLEELEGENARLQEQLQGAPTDNKRARPPSFDGKPSVGEESSRKKSKPSQEKKPAPGKGKGKGKRKQSVSDDEEEDTSKRPKRGMYSDSESDYISDEDDNGDLVGEDVRALLLQRLVASGGPFISWTIAFGHLFLYTTYHI
ncbi:hypothetical protein M378DRAFT_18093 [Amanita muscaria Koide BX008]|uniref:Uncharacterized protein n=1 Tax=Amanita muscaria (strain Koide BX008) TaxID=946122 RepID=A0A0C2WGN1_AMAMK|nr:hypothetical protein M378DRAFT_18093 [Amanita muscaria Koide BX008]